MEKIFIVTHKTIKKPIKKFCYSYIQVNADRNKNLGFEYCDNVGENIAIKNANYCELTALYWIWKNFKCNRDDIIGICHYRRFFSKHKYFRKIAGIGILKKFLKKYDMIVPSKFYFDVTTYLYYDRYAGKKKDLDKTRQIISKLYPEYVNAFDEYCSRYEGHYCNMMVCQKEIFDKYCEWLFNILFELEKNVDLSMYNTQEARIFGYISELLLNVYIIKNKLKVKEMYLYNVEKSLMYRIKKKMKQV